MAGELAAAASGAAQGTAIMPGWGTAVGAGIGLLSNYFGSRRSTPNYYAPGKGEIRGLAAKRLSDINRLYGPNPYSGSDLGFGQNVMEARMTPASDEAAAEYRADVGNIERNAAVGGGANMLTGAYLRGKQRALQGSLARISDIRDRNLIADAVQRRSDFFNRYGVTNQAYAGDVNLYNAAEAGKRATADYNRSLLGETVGDTATSIAAAYAGRRKPPQPDQTTGAPASSPTFASQFPAGGGYSSGYNRNAALNQ